MSLKKKIYSFLKGLGKRKQIKSELEHEAKPFDRARGKRPEGFVMPEWAQQDYFQKKDIGTMKPPEELADEGSLRRPGDWLRKKLAGGDEIREFEKVEQTKHAASRKVGMSDQEIDDFLGDFIKKQPKKNKTLGAKRKKKPKGSR